MKTRVSLAGNAHHLGRQVDAKPERWPPLRKQDAPAGAIVSVSGDGASSLDGIVSPVGGSTTPGWLSSVGALEVELSFSCAYAGVTIKQTAKNPATSRHDWLCNPSPRTKGSRLQPVHMIDSWNNIDRPQITECIRDIRQRPSRAWLIVLCDCEASPGGAAAPARSRWAMEMRRVHAARSAARARVHRRQCAAGRVCAGFAPPSGQTVPLSRLFSPGLMS